MSLFTTTDPPRKREQNSRFAAHNGLMEMDTEKDSLVHVDIKDSGNVDTLLTQVYSLGTRIDLAQTETFKRVMSLASQHINPVLRTGSNCVSFRIRGLEFASLHVGSAGKLTFGVGKQEPVDTASDWNELKRLVDRIIGEYLRAGAICSIVFKPNAGWRV